MNLTCPSCGATFQVEAERLGPAGRRVRCGECRHNWHQKPLGEGEAVAQAAAQAVKQGAKQTAEQASAKTAAAPFAPSEADAEPAPEPAAEPGFEPAPEPAEPEPAGPASEPVARTTTAEAEERVSRRTFSKPARPQRQPSQASLAAGWALFFVVVAGLAAGFYFGRAPLATMAPGITRLYDLAGIEDPSFILGLEVRIDNTEPRLVDGEQTVAIEGRVVNLSGGYRQVPPLRASVTNAEDEEIDSWTFQASGARLPPGGSTGFDTVARNPPRGGNVFIDFIVEN